MNNLSKGINQLKVGGDGKFLACTFFLLVIFFLVNLTKAENSKPNILIIVADDLGWKDVGYHDSEILTPSIDWLANNGAKLESFYVHPVCTQTRAAFLTGRYPFRYGLHNRVIKPDSDLGLPLSEQTLTEVLKQNGYSTAIIGKWHLGSKKQFLPTNRGFDYHYGNYCGQIDYFTHNYQGKHDWYRNGEVLKEEGYVTDLISKDAVRFIKEHKKDKPFFLYLPFTAPHGPVKAQNSYLEKYSHIQDLKRRTYAAAVSNLDNAIGEVIESLKETKQLDDTLILFFSDNGGSFSSGANNHPFKGEKRDLFEGAIRVPAFAYWSKKIAPGININQTTIVLDLVPTILDILNLKSKIKLDGESIFSLLEGKLDFQRENVLLAATVQGIAARQGDYKLIFDKKNNKKYLYNLASDPGESNDLSSKEKTKVTSIEFYINNLIK